MPNTQPLDLARQIVAKARAAGADQADALAVAGRSSSVTVRLQDVESVVDAASRAVGLRVIVGGRQSVVSTSDVSESALDDMVTQAMGLARLSEPDEHAGLPDPAEQAASFDQLQIFDEAVEALSHAQRLERALTCEQAALDTDSRITNSGGATCSSQVVETALANSLGFADSSTSTSVSVGLEVMGEEPDGRLRNDHWFSSERALHRLEPPEAVGRRAAARALRQLGAQKTATQRLPVVWEPQLAASLAGIIARAASGEALYRRSTFLAGREGEALAASAVSIVDDATLPGRLGSRPFDGEGVGSRRNLIIEDGVFQGFLFDAYSARRCDRKSTGSAVRDVGGLPGVGHGNLIWEAGDVDPEEIIRGVKEGLYLTTLMGFGINLTTGDFSRGAAGIWIRDGELAEPVTEINVSGTLQEMLAGVDTVGNDLQWFGGTAAPTVRMASLMISGT